MINNKLNIKNEKYKIEKIEGITLISLVITIILLIILAWIGINISIGENGLFSRAKYAKQEYLNEQESEEQKINDLYSKMLIATNGSSQITVNIEDLRKIINEQILNSYPIGSIYISTSETNPSEFIGGQWESYGQGRTLIGAGTGIDDNSTTMEFIANSVGGEYNHNLTISEMPKHFHKGLYYGGPNNNLELTLDQGTKLGYKLQYYGSGEPSSVSSGSSNYTGYEGQSQSHNNIQPYIVTYMWKRIL